MSLLTEVVSEEVRRIERMTEGYERELSELPKGVLVTKTVKGNQYYYLQYRNKDKTISEYIGKDTEQIEDLQNKIARRKHIQKMLKSLHEEYAKAQKMLEVCV